MATACSGEAGQEAVQGCAQRWAAGAGATQHTGTHWGFTLGSS